MIKTVAHSRVLPLCSKQGGTRSAFRDKRYSKKLKGADKKLFRQALSHAVGLIDYYDLKEKVSEYYQELQELKLEREGLIEQVAQLAQEKADFDVVALILYAARGG